MLCDPVMMSVGVPFLVQAGHKMLVDKATTLFMTWLVREAERAAPGDTADPDVQPPSEALAHVEDEDATQYLFDSVMGQSAISSVASRLECESEPIAIARVAYDAWSNHLHDWNGFLRTIQKVEKMTESAVKSGNCFYLSSVVDVLLWWRVHAVQHPLVSRVASRVLATPVSNGLQERVFSLTGRIDSPLRQSLGKEKFEMLSTLSFNKNFVDEIQKACLLPPPCSISNATKTLIAFYGLDDNLEQDETESGRALTQFLHDATVDPPSKKPRLDKE